MGKRLLAITAFAVVVGAVFFVFRGRDDSATKLFIETRGSQFVVGGRPFRFVGANVAVMYRDEDRARMPETLKRAADAGVRVVRVWASGEGGPKDVGPV